MIKERQSLKSAGLTAGDCSQRKAALSKCIRKVIRKDLRDKKRQLINERLDAFTDLKQINCIRKGGKKNRLTNAMDRDGKLQDTPQAVADVFADFYEHLYRSRVDVECNLDASGDQSEEVPGFSCSEVETELKKWQRKRLPMKLAWWLRCCSKAARLYWP